LLVADIKQFPIISSYPICCGIGNKLPRLLRCVRRAQSSATDMRQTEKGFFFGYPICLKKPDGIMMMAENLAGG